MRSGGEIVMLLHPLEAPSNAARFVRLARQGYLDGLTFHRVVANFVI
jgi:peptidyl-prolyl cis-trans isomerase B (cyclophilin B)